jgi:predicted metalloprotease with PDZ domain
MVLTAVQRESVYGQNYQSVIHKLKQSSRPIELQFKLGGGVQKVYAQQLAERPDLITVTFTEPGTLGLKFAPNNQTGNIELLKVNAGTQAEKHAQLKAGLILSSVSGAAVTGRQYTDVIQLIKVASRPLQLSFSRKDSKIAGQGSDSAGVAVTFTEPGALGLKFTPNQQTGHVKLLQVNPGTQAERHSQLRAGLILRTVSGSSVAGKSYQEVLGMIKAGGRPLSMAFSSGGTVASSPCVSSTVAAPDAIEGLTGKAAQKALHDHIMKSGTGNVKKIDRLRRASLQPDSKAPIGQKARMIQLQ